MAKIDDTPGNDNLAAAAAAAAGSHIVGTEGDDHLSGGAGDDLIEGRAGHDSLNGGNGTDILYGGDGNDYLSDTSDSAVDEVQNEQLYGEGGNDSLYLYRTRNDASIVRMDGGSGNDRITFDAWHHAQDLTMIGGDGNDIITLIGGKSVTIDAGAGADTVSFNFSEEMTLVNLTLGAGTDLVEVRRDRFTHNDLPTAIHITDFNSAEGDRIFFDGFLKLLTGWDYVTNPFATGHLRVEQRAGVGAVLQLDFNGGGDAYNDFIVFEGTAASSLGVASIGLAIDGSDAPGLALDGGADGDTIVGSSHDDVLRGFEGDDRIAGNAGDDLIDGGLGNDVIDGGWGTDVLTGGDGNDYLADFHSGDDSFYGGAGNDELVAERSSAVPDTTLLLDGGAGDDELRYAPFNETPYRRLHDDVRVIGGEGNDYIYVSSPRTAVIEAGDGDDNVSISSFGTVYTISLGAGADTLNLGTTRAVGPAVVVSDYQTGASGDRLELDYYLRGVLTGWDPTTSPFETGFVEIVQRGPDSVLRIDRDGPSGAGGWADLVIFSNTNAASFTGRNLGGYSSIAGTEGNDTIGGDDGIDFIRGHGGNDILSGFGKSDTLEGGSGDDLLWGGEGDDKLDGGTGADEMRGGGGKDVYIVDDAGDEVIEDAPSPWYPSYPEYDYDLVRTSLATYVLPDYVERLTGTSASGQTLTGNAIDNVIVGGDGNDFIYLLEGKNSGSGGAGEDRIEGGSGVDSITGGPGSDLLFGHGGNDNLNAGYPLGALTAGNDRLEGGAGDDWLRGNRGDDVLLGGDGNDRLDDSEGGADLLDGGEGNDQFSVSPWTNVPPATATVIGGAGNDIANLSTRMGGTLNVDMGEGDDQVYFYTSFSGAANLTLGAGRDTIMFSDYSSSFQPGSSVTVGDFVTGPAGDIASLRPFLSAWLTGWDKITNPFATGHVRLVQSGTSVLLQLDRNGGGDSFVTRIVFQNSNAADFTADNLDSYAPLTVSGTDGADTIRGSSGSDVLNGGDGNDLLHLAGGGNDSALGGAGNDVLYFGAAFTGADQADGGDDRDSVVLQGNYALALSATNLTGVESLSLQSGARTTWGDTANNFYDYNITTHDANVAAGQQLIVNGQSLRAGEDFAFDGSAEQDGKFLVYGGHGVDTLEGGAGDDVFFFEGARWGVGDSVDGGAGRDALIVSAGSGLTRIEFGATSLTGIESISVTSRYATDPSAKPSYEFVLDNGNVAPGATLIVNASSLVDPTQTLGVDGSDVQDGKLVLIGGAGGDTLIGGSGADLIQGLLGADDLTGGGGADTFRYGATAESTAASMDEILDFTPGTDKVDLARIDANSLAAGDQAFSWIGSNAFGGTGATSAGELRAYEQGGSWFVEGDTNGDGIADLVIELTLSGPTPLGQGDFLP